MSLVSTGLPNGGATTHYKFSYDSSLGGAGGIEPARTTALMASCDADFDLMQSWFAGVAFPFSQPMEVHVLNDSSGGADWGPPVELKPGSNDAGYMRMLMIAEVTEMFMKSQAKGWFPGNEGSLGEGLSRFLAEQFLISSGVGLAEFPSWGWTANSWLSDGSWPDWVNHVDSTGDTAYVEIGCSILFIYYLFTQLNFTIDQIVAAAASNLAGVYANLTGDGGDPFPFFKALMQAFPGAAGLSSGNEDNPFPVALTSVWVEKSSFGVDEVQDVIHQSGGVFTAAFWVVVEGFSKASFDALGVTVDLSGSLMSTNGITVTPSATAQVDYEDPGKPNAPQRIRIPYDITFATTATPPFPAVGGSPNELDLGVHLVSAGQKVQASDSGAAFELLAGADPYFTNVDPTQGNVFYLSEDLRVFTATPAQQPVPVAGGPSFTDDSIAGAFAYIQALLAYLNGNSSFTTGAQDPFTTVLPSQSGAFQGDSSVTPVTLDLSNPFDPKIYNNYNFAIARVRLRGSSGSQGAAQDVKVFFRLWATQTADTDYDPAGTYLSTPDAAGLPGAPLVGAGNHTIPFFASGNLSTNSDYSAGGINNQTVTIAANEDTAWCYFGCFLNVYDPSNQVGGQPVQALLAGTHHCLVAQIACDSAPIPTGSAVTPSPENSDKLAQRNLQITTSDNPGGPDSHRIPQTFDVRPSPPLVQGPARPAGLPDELMIDWGNVPVGSTASIFWPAVKADDVIALADQLYSFHTLRAADINTIECVVTAGVTYVPIPPATGESYAALLTIDLPTTVVAGQQFEVVVRRVATASAVPVPVPEEPRAKGGFGPEDKAPSQRRRTSKAAAARADATAAKRRPRVWRFVTGAFQVTIPVGTPATLLHAEETTLAIMKWRLQAMPPSSRWYPVLKRYIDYIAARVKELGGHPDKIPPSLQGAPLPKPKEPCREGRRLVGHVAEIRYDCFGEFEGFVLRDCCDTHDLRTREEGLGEVVLTAFRYRLKLAVVESHAGTILNVLIV